MIPTATTPEANLDPARVICSSITLRHLPLDLALTRIAGLGFAEIDLGALPGVCNHVPYELTEEAVEQVALAVKASGLRVRSVNADVGDLNQPLDAEPGYIHHSIGNGQVDFADSIAALEQSGYHAAYFLELETRDVSDDDRAAAALRAGRYVSALLAEQGA